MPVPAGSAVIAILPPRTLTPGRSAAALSAPGLRPAAGRRLNCRPPDAVTIRMRPAGRPRLTPRATAADSATGHRAGGRAAVDTQPQGAARGRAVLADALNPPAHAPPRGVTFSVRARPRAGRSVATSAWRRGATAAGGSASRYRARGGADRPAAHRVAR